MPSVLFVCSAESYKKPSPAGEGGDSLDKGNVACDKRVPVLEEKGDRNVRFWACMCVVSGG